MRERAISIALDAAVRTVRGSPSERDSVSDT
jgi:hypothetical protein